MLSEDNAVDSIYTFQYLFLSLGKYVCNKNACVNKEFNFKFYCLLDFENVPVITYSKISA